MIAIENFSLSHQKTLLLKNLTFKCNKNLAIIGKSGCGKSLLAKSLIKLVDQSFNFTAKRFQVGIYNLLDKRLNTTHLRKDYALILQDAHASFYPYLDIGSFFDIVLKTHLKLNQKQRKQLAFDYFHKLGLSNLEFIWHSYIHQLSGGMARRVQIALALALEPKMLLCDEITASLDEKSTHQLLQLLQDLTQHTQLFFITHDLHHARILSEEVLILQSGEIIEHSNTKQFFQNPTSAYGREILNAYKESKCF